MEEVAHKERGLMSQMRSNPWMVSTVILGVLFLIVLFANTSGSFGAASSAKVGQDVVSYLNGQTGGGVVLNSVEREGSLYKITVNYQGSAVPLYATLDGKNLVPQVTPLDGSTTPANPSTPKGPVNIDLGDAPVTGSANAKVTVVEFSDFSCPFCAAASGDNAEIAASLKSRDSTWEPIVTNLMKDYVQTGRVRFAVKYSMGHTGGHPAQIVAWCLNEQNLYWKFYPQAFAHQADVEDAAKMKALAQTIPGVNMAALQTCIDSGKYNSRFDKEQAEGAAAGAQGTPAFFINGQLVSGAVPYSQVKALIESELAKA